jgi:histidinol-phosphatase (PHP family)
MFYDCHLHTNASEDADMDITALAETIKRHGLSGICITDHCEYIGHELPSTAGGWSNYHGFIYLYDRSRGAYCKLRELLPETDILFGVEIGLGFANIENAKIVMAEDRYDFVITSIHSVGSFPDFCCMDFRGYDAEELYDDYLDEVIKLIGYGGFDFLAHLTYPLRYIKNWHIKFDDMKFTDKYIEIFDLLIKKDIALEVNTSGLKFDPPYTMPHFKLLKLYADRGGYKISLGSDSHRAPHVGTGFAETAAMLESIGINHQTVFRRRKPFLMPL